MDVVWSKLLPDRRQSYQDHKNTPWVWQYGTYKLSDFTEGSSADLLNSFFASGNYDPLLTTFANSLDPDPERRS